MSFGTLELPTLVQPFSLDLSQFNSQITTLQASLANAMKPLDAQANATAALNTLNTATNAANGSIKTMTATLTENGAVITRVNTETTAQAAALQQVTAARVQGITQINAARTATENERQALVAARTEQVNARTAILQTNAALKAQADQTKQTQSAMNGLGAGIKSAFGSFGSGIAFGAGALVGRAVFDDIAQGVGFLKDSVIGLNASLQQSSLAFTALTGSAATSKEIVTGLEGVAQHSVFGLPQLQAAAQQLLAYGANASAIVPEVTAIGTAAAASGGNLEDKFSRISYVIAELNSGIPLSERQIRELGTAGVAIQPIADALGVTTAQLRDAGKTGSITAQQFVDAFNTVYGATGKFGDFMQQQTQTFNGALQLIRTNVGLALAEAFKPLFDAVSRVAVAIGNFVQSDAFGAWAQNVKTDVQAVIDVFGTLLSILGTVLSPLAQFFGISIDFKSPAAGADALKSSTQGLSEAEQAAKDKADSLNQQLKTQKQAAKDAQAAIDAMTPALEANAAAMDNVKNKIADTQDYYAGLSRPIQDALDKINALTPEEINRKIDELNLGAKEIQLKLAKPDVSAFDATIKELQDQAKDIGKGTLDGFNKSIDDTANKIHNLEQQTSAGLDASIRALQNRIRDVGLGATDAIDINIANLKAQLTEFSNDPALQAINDQITALQATINAPALDTTASTNALAGLAAQIQGGGAGAAAALSQYQQVSAQRASAVTADQQQRSQAQTALQALQEQAKTMKAADDVHIHALDDAIKRLEDQKGIIDATNKATKDALQAQLNALDVQKQNWDANHQAALKALQDQQYGFEQQKKAQEAINQAAKDKNASDLEAAQQAKTDALASYNSAMAQITAQKEHDQLLDDQANTQKQILALPLEQQLKAINQQQKDALAPLQDQQKEYEKIQRGLDVQKKSLEDNKRIADAAVKSIEDEIKNLKPPPAPVVPSTQQKFLESNTTDLPQEPTALAGFAKDLDDLNKKLETFNGWVEKNRAPVLALAIALVALYGGFKLVSGVTSFVTAATSPAGIILGIVASMILLDHWIQTNKADWPGWVDKLASSVAPLDNVRDAMQLITDPGGTLDHFENRFTAVFTSDGTLDTVISTFMPFMTGIFGDSGTLTGLLGGFAGFTGFLGLVHASFDDSGTLHTVIGTFFPFLDGIFGNDHGTLGQLLGGFAGFTNFLTMTNSFFNSDGTIPKVITTFFPFMDGIFGDQGTLKKLLGRVPGFFSSMGDAIGKALGALPNTIIDPLNKALGKLQGFVDGTEGAIHSIGDFFGIDALSNLKEITIPLIQADKLASGTDNWRGGAAIVGEAGRELVHRGGGVRGALATGPGQWELVRDATLLNLPAGSTVLPNNITEQLLAGGVPGFAGGLVGEVLGAIGSAGLHLFGEAAGKGVDWILGKVTGLVPKLDLPGVFAALDTTLGDTVATGLKDMVNAFFGKVPSQSFAATQTSLDGGPAPSGAWAGVVNAATGYIGSGDFYNLCEMFVEMMDRAAGFAEPYYDTAYQHATSVPLYSSPPPAGASLFFDTSWSTAGHTAIATGNGNRAISTPIVGLSTVGYADIIGAAGYMGWSPPGDSAQNPMYAGGYITEPVLGLGMKSGQSYSFGERGIEEVVSAGGHSAGGGAQVTVTFEPGSIVGSPGMSTEELATAIADEQESRVKHELHSRGYRFTT